MKTFKERMAENQNILDDIDMIYGRDLKLSKMIDKLLLNEYEMTKQSVKETPTEAEEKANDIIENLNNEISWDNWQGEKGKYFEIEDVFYSRLEWLRDFINNNTIVDDKEEHFETIDMLIKYLKASQIYRKENNTVSVE